jgi:hypothetical protein
LFSLLLAVFSRFNCLLSALISSERKRKRKDKGGGFLHKEGGKAAADLENYSWPLSGLKFFNRSVITVLYVERAIAIYDLF